MSNNNKINSAKIEEAKQILSNKQYCEVEFKSACGTQNVVFKITQDAPGGLTNIQMDAEPQINETLQGQLYSDYAMHFLGSIQKK